MGVRQKASSADQLGYLRFCGKANHTSVVKLALFPRRHFQPQPVYFVKAMFLI